MGDLNAQVDDFVTKLRRRQASGSLYVARRCTELLRQVISQQRLPPTQQAQALIDAVKAVGQRLIAANPIELAIGNVVRRVLHIIREEDAAMESKEAAADGRPGGNSDSVSDTSEGGSDSSFQAPSRTALRAPSLHNMLELAPGPRQQQQQQPPPPSQQQLLREETESRGKGADKSSRSWQLKHNTIDGVSELLSEINNFHSQVAEQALEHIHQNEVVLTVGRSRTLLSFLLEANKMRSFQIVAAEGAPRYEGHVLARELATAGLQTTLITDSAIFAMMARVNVAIVTAHAVMANGGVIAPSGMRMAALAARRHAVPFVVLAGLFKLCPVYPHNPSTILNDMKSPAEVLDFGEFSDCLDEALGQERVQAVNPAFDYIPPDLVSLFITDTGGHNPSYVYRLVAEYYSPEDNDL